MKDVISLNETIKFVTDAATLVVFDPEVLNERINDEIDWWCNGDFKGLAEVQHGFIALVSLGNDGSFKVRITTESLTQDEKDFSRSIIGPLGVTSKSGKIFFGKGECLTGGGETISYHDIDASDGQFIELPAGNYDLLFYYINADGYVSESKSKSLPDIVIVINPRIEDFSGVKEEPFINTATDTFLFPSKNNASKLKPKLNKILKAKVWSTERTSSGKALKEWETFWPKAYQGWEIVLEDMSQVAWKDKIVIKTTRLDEENKLIYAELIEKLPNNK